MALAACERDGGHGHMGEGDAGPPARTELPEAGSEDARLYIEFCGQCHGAPEPSTHPAYRWPAVVARMERHMRVRGAVVPPGATLARIVAYLQRHSP